jgi:hypothetical protein
MKATIFGKKYKPAIPIPVDGWNMYTITSDGINPRIYKNGSPLNLVSAITTGTYVKMDYSYESNTIIDAIRANQFVDDFMFYSRLLTNQEISGLWNSGNGVAYNSLTAPQKAQLQRYCSFDNTNIDRVSNSSFVQLQNAFFSTTKKIGTHSVAATSNYGTIKLGSYDYFSLNISNETQDIPYTMNLWMKNGNSLEGLRIYKGFELGEWRQFNYEIIFSMTTIKLIYYSLDSFNDKKTFTFNL